MLPYAQSYFYLTCADFAKNPITTRAHLLDIVSWLEKTGGKPLEGCKNTTPITLTHLKQCAADYGVKFAPGDLLIVRSGFTEAFLALTDEERANYSPLNGAVGVEASEEVMRWIWEQGFAAVAGDTFAFESWPPPGFVKPEKGKISLHECFLSSWGLPIGELFDLRELSQKCAQYNKWTFFFSSMTLPVDAGIGSPANAQAVL